MSLCLVASPLDKTYEGWSENNVTSRNVWKLNIVEKFCFPGVETDGANYHTANMRVGSES